MSNKYNMEELDKVCQKAYVGLWVNQWLIGDKLLEDCPMGDNKNKEYREECRNYLKQAVPVCKKNNFRYSVSRLRELRNISHLYPADRRRADVGYEVHVVVRNPDYLDMLIRELPEGQDLTKRYAKHKMKQIHAIERAKWRELHGLEPIPTNRPLPVGDLQSFALSLKLVNNAYTAVKLAEDTNKMLNQQGPHDSADNALFDAAMRAHQAWINIVNRMRGIKEAKPNKRPNLAAVNI